MINTQHFSHSMMPLWYDPVQLTRILLDVQERAKPIIQAYIEKHGHGFDLPDNDPLNLKDAYLDFLDKLMRNPQKLFAIQGRFWQEWLTLCNESAARFFTGKGSDTVMPEKSDRRFKDKEWAESFYFDFIKQSYLLFSRHMQEMVEQADDMDKDDKIRLKFYVQQLTDALSPTNYLFTNPEVLRETLDTNGENLIKGLHNLLEDIERGHGDLSISTTNNEAFKLGENIATTPGKIIYQNDLMQLIQYEPTTKTVHKTPLLITPPWINKYYILDLQEKNSFIKWAIAQGYTVFVISWVNPDAKLAQKRFEDYMKEGLLEALRIVQDITGEPSAHVIGYCLGGTLLSVTLAYLAAHKKEKQIKSATFFTTMVDFEQAGEMKLFMDEHQLSLLDKAMAQRGVLSASTLKTTFSMLCANDLIWSFVVNNYLLGREPFPFDLLYWNDDATNMPAAMHSFYMRKCYKDNLLPVAGGVEMDGTKIDMRKVKTPAYFLSAKDDHIAPWKATYATTQLFEGPTCFTLTASGHVAGVVNPPAANKYHFWSSEDTPADPDEWLAPLKSTEGSWWPHWEQWLSAHGKGEEKVPPRPIGNDQYKPLENAPGSYVRMRSE